jgi:hypothetical protein
MVVVASFLTACGGADEMPDGSCVEADADVASEVAGAPDGGEEEAACGPESCLPEGACRTTGDCDSAAGYDCVPPGTPDACGTCFDGMDECLADDDCGATEVCVKRDEPCLCHPYWACVPGCTADEGCAEGEACVDGHCGPAPCDTDEDCPGLFSCSDAGICVRRACTDDTACPGGFCVRELCQPTLGTCEQPAA